MKDKNAYEEIELINPRIVFIETSPCSLCKKCDICKHTPSQCANFRYWFHRNWRIVTDSLKEQRRGYIRFRIIYKD